MTASHMIDRALNIIATKVSVSLLRVFSYLMIYLCAHTRNISYLILPKQVGIGLLCVLTHLHWLLNTSYDMTNCFYQLATLCCIYTIGY